MANEVHVVRVYPSRWRLKKRWYWTGYDSNWRKVATIGFGNINQDHVVDAAKSLFPNAKLEIFNRRPGSVRIR